jgi:hypothetical protein
MHDVLAIVNHHKFANVNGIAGWVVCADNSALPHSPHPAERKNQKEKERTTASNAVFGPGPRIPHRVSIQWRTDHRYSCYGRSTVCESMCALWSLTDLCKKQPPIMPLLQRSSSDHHTTRLLEAGSWQGVAQSRSSLEMHSSQLTTVCLETTIASSLTVWVEEKQRHFQGMYVACAQFLFSVYGLGVWLTSAIQLFNPQAFRCVQTCIKDTTLIHVQPDQPRIGDLER